MAKWTQDKVRQGKQVASGRIQSLVVMTTEELRSEVKRVMGMEALPQPRETLLRYLIIEALDRAFPDSLKEPPLGP